MEACQSKSVLQVEPSQQSFRILLVEDDPFLVQMMLRVFERMQVPVDHVRNNSLAIRFVEDQDYDLTILDLDIYLENDTGFKLINLLKRQQPEMKFITMTENNPKSLESKVRELRVLYHFIKPFSIAEFTTVLKHTMKKSREH